MEKMDMIFYRKLPTPLEVKQQYPIGEEIEMRSLRTSSREETHGVF